MRGSWTSASVSRPICPSNTAAWWFHTVMLQKLFTEIYFWGHLRRETNALWRPVSRLMSCSTAANEDDYWETWRRQILEQFVTTSKKKKACSVRPHVPMFMFSLSTVRIRWHCCSWLAQTERRTVSRMYRLSISDSSSPPSSLLLLAARRPTLLTWFLLLQTWRMKTHKQSSAGRDHGWHEEANLSSFNKKPGQ